MKDKKKFWLIFSVAAVVLFVWMIRYKAINQDYRQRWSANTEKTYSVGEIVPIAPDFVGYNLAAEGYMLRVNRFEIVDYRAYTSALQYDGADRSRIPDILVILYGRKPIQLKQFLRFGTEIQGRVSSTM